MNILFLKMLKSPLKQNKKRKNEEHLLVIIVDIYINK